MTNNKNNNETTNTEQDNEMFKYSKSEPYKSSNTKPGLLINQSAPGIVMPGQQAIKAQPQMAPASLVHQSQKASAPVIEVVYDAKTDTEPVNVCSNVFVKSKVELPGRLIDTPSVYSKLNSVYVSSEPTPTLGCIHNLLEKVLGGDITQFDDKNFIIHALLFKQNEPVNIRVSVWNNIHNDGCTVEIKRMQGSCLAFNSLFNEIRGKIQKQLNIVGASASDSESEFSGTDFDFDSMPDLMSLDSLNGDSFADDCGFSVADLQSFADDINNDSFQLETLGIVSKCVSKKQVLEHQNLLDAITGCLKSNDLAVQKICARILS